MIAHAQDLMEASLVHTMARNVFVCMLSIYLNAVESGKGTHDSSG